MKRKKRNEKPIMNKKKLIAQTIISAVAFVFICIAFSFDTPFFGVVKNEVEYTLTYVVDIQEIYHSSGDVIKYLSGAIEQSKIYIDNAASEYIPASEKEDAPAFEQ